MPAPGDLLAGPGDVLALPVAPGRTGVSAGPDDSIAVPPATSAVIAELGVDLRALASAERMRGRAGEVVRVPSAPGRRVLLVGVGDATPTDVRRAGAALARAARGRGLLVTSLLDGASLEHVRAGVEGLLLGGWTPAATGTRNRSDAAAVKEARLLGAHPRGVDRGRVHASATALARDLSVTPSNTKNPTWLADRARRVARAEGLDVRVWDVKRLSADRFGGILAVGGGSASPTRLVRLDHHPKGASRSQRPVVLVGKGITFDTGGLSIKPREAMVPMKTDMSGAAAVLAALAACVRLGVRRHVVGLLPLAENAVGAASYRPGDVLTQFGGRTTEVLNTDAEGRLVLADALAYGATLNPVAMVDLATLTGSATLGLGRRHAALFATDDRLAGVLEAAAVSSGERVWRMPLVEDYRPALDSPVADLRQIPQDRHVGGGSITAALFLREFTSGVPWAHLDIAGTARSDAVEHEVPKGATGWGARLLLRWLEDLR
jgi:leucyl aminopeptidase